MLLVRTSAVGTRPVTLVEAKAQCRVNWSDDDTLITAMIGAACDLIGEMAGRVLATETWKVSDRVFCGRVRLPKSPIIAVTDVSYFDQADASQTQPVSDFNLFLDQDYSSIEPKTGKAWPVSGDRPDGTSITFTTGYTTIPDGLRAAILMTVAHLYANREATAADVINPMPLAVQELVAIHRLGWIEA
jgi:uncharacterized phiE125 gp8 family phage protein